MNKKKILTFLLCGLWINGSEFFRNEILLKKFWLDHYADLHLVFPSTPFNGLVWMLWGFGFAGVIQVMSEKFSFFNTLALSWFFGFVLMWLVVGNLGVLPFKILSYAIPLSLIEVALASFICHKQNLNSQV